MIDPDPQADGPPVTLLRQASYDPGAVKQAVAALLDPLGGMGAFVTSGTRVLLKPNLVMARTPDRAVTTHPTVVRAVAELALDCGGRVALGDSPGLGTCRNAAKAAGLLDLAEELSMEIIEFTPHETCADNRTFKTLVLAKELLDADVVINLPKLKTHAQMTMTLAVKNLFGAVVGPAKFQWHYRAGRDHAVFATMLYEICAAVRPALSILDGIVAMDGNGPTSGTPNPLGLLAASPDPCALDAAVLDILGMPTEHLPTLQAATRAGDTAFTRRVIRGDAPVSFRPARWTWPETQTLEMHGPLRHIPGVSRWLRKRLTPLPVPIPEACVRCGACERVCPADAITLDEAGVRIDGDTCIRCYCCHELCPHDAMELHTAWLARWLGLSHGEKAK